MMHDEPREIIEIDRHLVLAAPDLLAACQRLKAWWEGEGENEDWTDITKQIEAAISRATQDV